jgi:hypothetical protein
VKWPENETYDDSSNDHRTSLTSMADKLKAFLTLVAHTFFSFVAMLAGGCALYTSLRPLVGRERYQQLAHTPLIFVLLLTSVAMGGARVYLWWPDRRAFFVWVLPSIWVCHLALSRGIAAMEGKWADSFLFFGVGASYSVEALIAAMAFRKREPLSNS